MALALIVHGGAGAIPAARFAPAQAGCRAAVIAGWQILEAGGSALDAVQAAIMALEDNPGFNAGTGAVLTADGRAQLDAGIMDGSDLDVGAVAGVERIKNPIQLARRVLHSPHVMLAGAGAELFAVEEGLSLCDAAELVTPAQYARWRRGYSEGDDVNVAAEQEDDDGDRHGTVGAVAVDAQGRIAAGASTGGISAKHPGRIGDTPLVGCGFYAEAGLGGVSSTGHGEGFIRLLLAKRAVDYLGTGLSAPAAAEAAISMLGQRVGGSGGVILLDAEGRVGVARNTPAMAHGYMIAGMSEPRTGV
ncbi:MAG: isoaspartyl peptidase/L-asparaginase [Ktedonobacterales bacterium]